MNITRFSNPRLRRFLAFSLMFVAMMLLIERYKTSPLLPPQLDLLPIEDRSAANTDFTLPDLSGNAVRLADFRGKVILLNFFATWCAPCREEMPSLEQVFQQYKARGFSIVAVAGDKEGKKVVEPFVKQENLSFPVLLDAAGQVARQYRVTGIPTVFLFDRQGRLAAALQGNADWNSPQARDLIERLLQES